MISPKSIAELITDLDAAEHALRTARPGKQRESRERRRDDVLRALDDRVLECYEWLEKHYHEGVGLDAQDKQWLDILGRYQDGHKALWEEVGVGEVHESG